MRRVLGLMLLAAAPVLALPCTGTEDCLRRLEASQQSLQVMAARFEQTKHLSLLNEPLTSRGRFAFRRPDQVLWEVEDPPLRIRIDGSGVHLPDLPGLKEEAAAMAPFAQMMREMGSVFTGSLSGLSRSFDVSANPHADGVDLRLTPQTPQGRRMFAVIEVSFRGADLRIDSIRLQEALGDRLEIRFSDVHYNDPAAAAVIDEIR